MTIRTWFITGATSGFGRTMAEQLLERGERVAATGRKPEVLDNLRSRYPELLSTHALDVTDTAAIRATVEQVFRALGRVDVVVNSAGFGLFGAAEEVTDEQIHQQLETNLVGSIQVIRAFLPRLRAQGGGRILQISSAGGQTAYPNFSIYHASKWGIEGFIESLAQEVAPFHIGVTVVEPGATKTGFGQGLVRPSPLAAYDATPAGETRRAIDSGTFPLPGDVQKMVRRIIESTDEHPAPRRLSLGSDTFNDVRASLASRLAALDAQKDTALSVDVDR